MKGSFARLVFGAWISLLGLILIPDETQAKTAVGKFVAVVGRVSVTPEKAAQASTAAPGTLVFEGDTIEAESKSRAKILMIDDSVITITEETRLEINQYQLDMAKKSRRSLLKLVKGKVRALVSRMFGKRSLYRVKTPTAVMGVRGTTVVAWVEVDPVTGKKTAWFLFLGGPGEVSNEFGTVLVGPGMICKVPEGEAPIEPWLASPEEVQEALGGTVIELVPGESFLFEEGGMPSVEIQEVEQGMLGQPPLAPPPETPGATEPDTIPAPTSTEPIPQAFDLTPPSEDGFLPEPPPPPDRMRRSN
jgi:hypothetical protein